MNAKVEIDTTKFSAMLRDLKAILPGVKAKDLLRDEVGAILQKCVDDTIVMQVQKVVQRSERSNFTTMPGNLYKPKSGNRYRRGANVVYYLRNRYPSALWTAIQKRRKADLQKKLKARGLAKRSWVVVAEKLGITLKVPDYVKKAVATTGRSYFEDAQTSEKNDTSKLEIKIANSQPTAVATGGAQILQRAIDGRVKFFQQNLKRGVFESIDQVLKKYPGIKFNQNG